MQKQSQKRSRQRPSTLHHEPAAVTWAREKAGLTKRRLADSIGISEQLMGEIESGWRSATPANLLKIAHALNCPSVVLERKIPRQPERTRSAPNALPNGGDAAVADKPIVSAMSHQDGDEGTPTPYIPQQRAPTTATLPEPGQRHTRSLWLILDEDCRVLVVNPNYRGKAGKYQLVGGWANVDEPPHHAAIREAHEETGLFLVPDTLLITDYIAANPEIGWVEGTYLIFLHRLRPADRVVLNASGTPEGEEPKLLDYKFLAEHELDKYCVPSQAKRIREAMRAAADPSRRGYRFEGQPIAYDAV